MSPLMTAIESLLKPSGIFLLALQLRVPPHTSSSPSSPSNPSNPSNPGERKVYCGSCGLLVSNIKANFCGACGSRYRDKGNNPNNLNSPTYDNTDSPNR